jgi:hypothetical protein
MNLSYLTAMLITEGEPRYASDPLPYFQRQEQAREYHMSLILKGILVVD